jgi:hypothetical protein
LRKICDSLLAFVRDKKLGDLLLYTWQLGCLGESTLLMQAKESSISAICVISGCVEREREREGEPVPGNLWD